MFSLNSIYIHYNLEMVVLKPRQGCATDCKTPSPSTLFLMLCQEVQVAVQNVSVDKFQAAC